MVGGPKKKKENGSPKTVQSPETPNLRGPVSGDAIVCHFEGSGTSTK